MNTKEYSMAKEPSEIMDNENGSSEDSALLKIGELAAMAGVSPKALRIYEQKNILRPVKVAPETGYRYYSPDQHKLLDALIELQDMGFSLNEIELLLSGKLSEDEAQKIFEEKRKTLNETIWKAQAQIEELDAIADGLFAKDMKEMSDEERAWHLAKLVRVSDHNVHQTLSEILWL